MEYSTGTTGRVFFVKFEHGEDLLVEIKNIVDRENIAAGTITFLGALSKGEIVTGPVEEKIPAEPNWMSFGGAWEVFGFGTLARGEDGSVKIHAHGAFGKKESSLAGCLRKDAKIFITIEAVITEIKNTRVLRKKDEAVGHDLLAFA